ncbi:MAG: hypothetical protein ACQCN3_13320 [Candidatus Bathyarchaeia archaeon]
MGRTIGIDDKTYKELVRLTAHFMQKTEEQISLSDIVRLSVYLFKGCLDNYPELGKQILNQIDFGEQKELTKDFFSKDIIPEWFGKDFLDFIFGVEDLRKRCLESGN